MEFAMGMASPHAVRRWLRPAARRPSKRTVPTQCPSMTRAVFLRIPTRIGETYAVRSRSGATRYACMMKEHRGAHSNRVEDRAKPSPRLVPIQLK